MDATRGLTSHYGSLVMPGTGLGARGDARGGQYDLTKGGDAFSSAAAAGYYAMSRFGSDLGVDTGLPGACTVRLVAADCGSHCCTYHPVNAVL